MTVKEFAAAAGITPARARVIAPTIPGATRDQSRTIAGRHPWKLPEDAVELYQKMKAQAEAAQKKPEPPADFPPAAPETPKMEKPAAAKTGKWTLILFLTGLAYLMNRNRANQNSQNQTPPPTDWSR